MCDAEARLAGADATLDGVEWHQHDHVQFLPSATSPRWPGSATPHRYGNPVAATIPIALSAWNERARFAHGDRVVLSAFGAGFTAGSIFLRWATV